MIQMFGIFKKQNTDFAVLSGPVDSEPSNLRTPSTAVRDGDLQKNKKLLKPTIPPPPPRQPLPLNTVVLR